MRSLVIISVPYLRVARTLLGPRVLDALAGCDCVVASPFSQDENFRAEYGRPGMQFLQVPGLGSLPRLLRGAYAFSEIMRMGGFWRRYRGDGLAYHWSVAGARFGDDGNDGTEPAFWRTVRRVASLLGTWPGAWRWVDRLLGRRLFPFPALDELASQYESVTLLQAASWGYQDRLLASHAGRKRFRTVLIPYTTDQLWVNGYLLCDYDAVCVQGPFEERCARNYHEVTESRLVRLGSMWFRAIDDLRHGGLRSAEPPIERTVLYAGVSRTYFPRRSEFQAVDALLDAMRAGRFGRARIVYRPYAVDPADRAELEQRYAGTRGLELQWPEEVCAGLEDYSGDRIAPQLVQYLQNLAAADVVVMSHTTSLGWDAAYLGCGVIANFADETGVLQRRGTELRFSVDGLLDCAPGLPVARSVRDMVDLVAEQLARPDAAARSRSGVLSDWDYPNVNTQALLPGVIHGGGRSALAEPLPVVKSSTLSQRT